MERKYAQPTRAEIRVWNHHDEELLDIAVRLRHARGTVERDKEVCAIARQVTELVVKHVYRKKDARLYFLVRCYDDVHLVHSLYRELAKVFEPNEDTWVGGMMTTNPSSRGVRVR